MAINSGEIARTIAEGGFSSIQSLVEHMLEVDPSYFADYEKAEEACCNNCGYVYYEEELDANGNCPDCVAAFEEEEEEELRQKIELDEAEMKNSDES